MAVLVVWCGDRLGVSVTVMFREVAMTAVGGFKVAGCR